MDCRSEGLPNIKYATHKIVVSRLATGMFSVFFLLYRDTKQRRNFMREKISFLTIVAIGAITMAAHTARAATMCAYTSPDASWNCDSYYGTESYLRYDWESECGISSSDGTKRITFSGVAALSTKCDDQLFSNASIGQRCNKLDGLTHSELTNPYCLCKLTYPFVSKWILVESSPGANYHCAGRCKEGFASDTSFRNAMLNSPLY